MPFRSPRRDEYAPLLRRRSGRCRTGQRRARAGRHTAAGRRRRAPFGGGRAARACPRTGPGVRPPRLRRLRRGRAGGSRSAESAGRRSGRPLVVVSPSVRSLGTLAASTGIRSRRTRRSDDRLRGRGRDRPRRRVAPWSPDTVPAGFHATRRRPGVVAPDYTGGNAQQGRGSRGAQPGRRSRARDGRRRSRPRLRGRGGGAEGEGALQPHVDGLPRGAAHRRRHGARDARGAGRRDGRARVDLRPAVDARPHVRGREVHPRLRLVVAPVSSFSVAGTGCSRSKTSSSCWATMEAIEMAAPAKQIGVSVEERRELERIVRSRTAEQRTVERARIVLAAAAGRPAARIASEVGSDFDAQAAEVCGLYLDPPAGTLVVSIDEKTGIQAKAPTRPDVKARPGRPSRREYESTRNGTQNLFAALRVHTGEVSAMPAKTRNRFDLLRFLDQLEAEIPAGRQVIAISDNLSTRTTTEVSDWLADHPRWRFVFTPKHASWLNQVEIFFSILARRLLKRGAFTSERDLAQQMLAFVETYNQTARPFNWTYTGKVLAA